MGFRFYTEGNGIGEDEVDDRWREILDAGEGDEESFDGIDGKQTLDVICNN